MKKSILMFILVFNAGIMGVSAQDIKEQVAMIRKNLADSKEKMKTYEWIETTTVFVKGEQKSLIEKQCYYSVDGKLTKVETGGSKKKKTPGGLRGKIAKNKKEDMMDYAKAAVAKIHTYLPPKPEKIQAIYAAGKVSVQILEPQNKFKLSFPGYNEPGDMLSVSIDKPAQKIMALDVTTTVKPKDKEKAVFNITYANLPDGTQYAGTTTLNAPEKDLKVVIENSGFKHAATK